MRCKLHRISRLALSVRDSAVAAQAEHIMLSPVRPFVYPSVSLSITRVDQSKWLYIMQFSPHSSPIPLVLLRAKFHPEIPTGFPGRGRQTKVGLGKQAIL